MFRVQKAKPNWRVILGGLVLFFSLEISPVLAANAKPVVGTITPASGSSNPNQLVSFTTTFSDANGWRKIKYVYFLINTSLNGARCFYGYYNQNKNKLYLRNDTNTRWLGGYIPGSSRSIENSYATLDCVGTRVFGAGSTLTLNWSITFKPTFLGSKNLYLYVKDDANASSGWVNKGTWTIQAQPFDTTAPTGSIKINNDSLYSTSALVTLNLSAQDNAGGSGLSQMQFSNDNSTYSNPEVYATTKSWNLTSGDDLKRVYVKFSDQSGNWSGAYSDTILLITTPIEPGEGEPENPLPAGPTRTLQAQTSVSLDVNKDGFVVPQDVLILINYLNTNGSGPTTPGQEHLDVNKDGQIAPVDVLIVINYLNNPYPLNPLRLLLAGPDALGASEASFGWVKLDTSLNLIAYRWRLKKPDNSFTPWLKQGSNLLNLRSEIAQEGSYTLELEAQYQQTYWSGTLRHSFLIERNPPTGTIKINNDSQYTNTTAVVLNLSATDSGSGMGTGAQMQFSNNNTNWSAPEAYTTTKNWTLTLGDATKTVYAKFKDVAGNWSAAFSDTIILDTTKPTTPTVTDDGATTASTNTLHCRWSSSDNISGIGLYQYRITQDSISGPIIIDWTSLDTATEVTQAGLSLIVNKTYYFSVRAKDNAGLWSDIGYSDGIKVVVSDTTPPTGTIKINNDSQYTNTTAVVLNLSATDSGSGMGAGSQMQFSNNNSTWSTPEAYATTKNWTLASGDGTKTVYVKYKDVAGNWSAAYSDTIILDTTLPTITITEPKDGAIITDP